MNHDTNNLFYYRNPAPDEPLPEGALTGLTAVVRPNISVRKWPARAGSKALENYHPIEDATVVERIRNQGVRLTGMSRMSELGLGIVSETGHRLVSEQACDFFLGTDICGETRHLSILAGAWGYKPSIGICPNLGIINLVPSMECVAVITRDPAAISRVLSVISGKESRDFSMLWKNLPEFGTKIGEAASGCKVGFIPEQVKGLEPGEQSAFRVALSGLSEKGIQVVECPFPDYALFSGVHQVVGATEASSTSGKYDGIRYGHRGENAANWNEMYLSSRQEAFGALIKSYLFQGAWFQFRNYDAFEHACRLRNHLVQKTRALFDSVDYIASPVRRTGKDASCAETIPDVYGAFSHTLMANVTGCPALCAPGMVRTGEADLGLQLMAPHLSDAKLLGFATRYL